jgi:hypothetical protein
MPEHKLYEECHVGYGILSLQAKESKHDGIKGLDRDLSLNNRSNKGSTNGKFCAQIMLGHSIFLNTNLHLHCIFLILSLVLHHTAAGSIIVLVDEQCGVCKAAKNIIIKCAKEKKLSEEVLFLFKRIICSKCNEHFSDVTNLKAHTDIAHCSQTLATESTRPSHSLIETWLKSTSVTELKVALKYLK